MAKLAPGLAVDFCVLADLERVLLKIEGKASDRARSPWREARHPLGQERGEGGKERDAAATCGAPLPRRKVPRRKPGEGGRARGVGGPGRAASLRAKSGRTDRNTQMMRRAGGRPATECEAVRRARLLPRPSG